MKTWEKDLLKRMHYEEQDSNNVPLANVKSAMGNLRYASGNPLTKTEIKLQIDTFFYDEDITSFITPTTVPAVLRAPNPVLLFGLTDYYGGYQESFLSSPLSNIWDIFGIAGVWGVNLIGIVPTAFQGLCERGDFIFMYHNHQWLPIPGNPNIYMMIRIRCTSVTYGTFLNSFVSDLITIDTIRMIVPIANIDQFINPLKFGYQNLFGKTFTDTIDPRMYITNKDFQQQIADIPLELPIDKAVMLNFMLNWNCQSVTMILFVKKVEALTHK